ncbi:MAG: surface-adhesin E family protein [Burkholderiales bacterium]
MLALPGEERDILTLVRAGVMLLLCVLSGPVLADWTAVGGDGTIFTAYADRDSIRRKGGSARMRGLYDYARPDLTPEGDAFSSTTVEREYDCAERLVRLLAHVDHSGRMGAGRVVASASRIGRWEAVLPGAVDEGFWNLACGG